MSTETFLQFWHAHLNTIIGVLIVSVLALLGVYLFLEFVKEKNQTDGSDGQAATNFNQIEDSLKKLLENAQLPAPAVADGGEASAEAKKELDTLQALVDEKDTLIKKLKEQADSASAGGEDGGNSAELEAKIRDLEARLMEYEIIEDDIADLSMYKEENAKLKEEIEGLKAGGATPSAEPQAAEAPVPTEQAPQEDVSEAAEADEADLGDDIMAEFAAAVQEQKKGEVPPVDKGAVPEEEPAKAEPDPAETLEQIVAEEEQQLPPDPVAEAAAQIDLDALALDTDKMLGEIEELNASAQEDDGTDALAGGIDTDKMLSEADDLNASVSGGSEADEQKKLAGEFDNFLKES